MSCLGVAAVVAITCCMLCAAWLSSRRQLLCARPALPPGLAATLALYSQQACVAAANPPSAGRCAPCSVVGGFSQGGHIAYKTVLTHSQPLAGCAALSTWLEPSIKEASRPHMLVASVQAGCLTDACLGGAGASAACAGHTVCICRLRTLVRPLSVSSCHKGLGCSPMLFFFWDQIALVFHEDNTRVSLYCIHSTHAVA